MDAQEILRKTKALNLPYGQYVVVGSAIMALLNIRSVEDLDILADSDLFDALKKQSDWQKKKKPDGSFCLKKDEAEVLSRFAVGSFQPSFSYLFKTAVFIEGVPFINLSNLVRFKKESKRPKDINDIRLIKKAMLKKDYR